MSRSKTLTKLKTNNTAAEFAYHWHKLDGDDISKMHHQQQLDKPALKFKNNKLNNVYHKTSPSLPLRLIQNSIVPVESSFPGVHAPTIKNVDHYSNNTRSTMNFPFFIKNGEQNKISMQSLVSKQFSRFDLFYIHVKCSNLSTSVSKPIARVITKQTQST